MSRLFILAVGLYLAATTFALAAPPQDVVHDPKCAKCGMDREKFGQSRMLIEYDDKSHVATCSIHCAAVDMASSLDKSPAAVKVADYNTRQLIDADKAVWVLGGKVSGVMTAKAKWAFGDKAAAEQFVKANGGEIVTYQRALEASYDEMEQDTRMIREKRKMKRMQQGGATAK
jgi:copper chaperone NosL